MKKTMTTLAALVLALPVYAQVHVGAGGKAGLDANAGASVGGAHVGTNADLKADAGADAKAANSNAGGEQRGLERAETRMSDEGKKHSRATLSHGKRKGPTARAETNSQATAGAGASTRTP